MGWKSAFVIAAAVVGGCTTPHDLPDQGLASVNEPVITRANYVLDVAAPGGLLAPGEAARVDSWFRSLNLGYGDAVYVDGPYSDAARSEIAQVAANYGLMMAPGAPVTVGALQPGGVRLIVSRNRAEVPNCPNWSLPAQPNYLNRTMSNYGCAVNSNLAAMVANPEDLVHGRDGGGVLDPVTAAKAVSVYRATPPTGAQGLQSISTKKDK